jgi:hypothetical protein
VEGKDRDNLEKEDMVVLFLKSFLALLSPLQFCKPKLYPKGSSEEWGIYVDLTMGAMK